MAREPNPKRRPCKIFVCYRRDDSSGHAGRLYDTFCESFARDNIFIDVDSIPAGARFAEKISHAVASCQVLIVVIGKRWLDTTSSGKRRLDDPDDLVRVEIATALLEKIPVIPVLVQGALPPKQEQLPHELTALSSIQAVELTDNRWKYDTSRLVETIIRLSEEKTGATSWQTTWLRKRIFWTIVGALLMVATGLLGGYRLITNRNEAARSVSKTSPTTQFEQPQASKAGGISEQTGSWPFALSYVRRIQTRLRELGLYNGEINGLYDQPTKDAILEFQRRNRLPADGIIGPATERLLFPN